MQSCGLKTIKIDKHDVPYDKVISALDAAKGITNIDQAIVESYKHLPTSVNVSAWEKWFRRIHNVSAGKPITDEDLVGYDNAGPRVFRLKQLLNMEQYIDNVKGSKSFKLLPETINIINATKRKLIKEGTFLDEGQVEALIASIESALFVNNAIERSGQLRKQAKINIKKKIGTSDAFPVLAKLVDVDMRIVPAKHREAYLNVLSTIAQRGAILDVALEGQLLEQAKEILSSLNEPKEYNISPDDPQEKAIRIDKIVKTRIDDSSLSLPEEKKLVKDLKKHMNEKSLEKLDNLQLQHLIDGINNINNGFVPHVVFDLIVDMKANAVVDIIAPIVEGIPPTGLTNAAQKLYGKVKSAAIGGNTNAINEIIRSSPLSVIDEVFGNKGKEIYNNLFRPLGVATDRLHNDSVALDSEADALETKWRKKLSGNKLVKSKYKIKLLEKQKESEANPGQFSALDYINRIIDDVNTAKTTYYTQADVKILEELLAEFMEEGKLSIAKIEASLTPEEKAVVDHNRELSQKMVDKIVYTSSVIRGERVDVLNEYSHSNVIDAAGQEADLKTIQARFKGSAKSGTLNERANLTQAPLISLDPLADSVKSAKMVLMDYYLTPEIRQAVRTTKRTLAKVGEANPNSEAASAAKALDLAVNEAIETELSVRAEQYSFTAEAFKTIIKNSYAVQLASLPRMLAELASNVSFALITKPSETIKGYQSEMRKDDGLALYIMNRGGSTQMSKLYDDSGTWGGKHVETSHFASSAKKKARGMTTAGEIMDRTTDALKNNKLSKGADWVVDQLLSRPDKMIARPVYWGAFESLSKNKLDRSSTLVKLKTMLTGIRLLLMEFLLVML